MVAGVFGHIAASVRVPWAFRGSIWENVLESTRTIYVTNVVIATETAYNRFMEARCIRCFKPFEFSGRGRSQKYCSATCRQAAYRGCNGLAGFPTEMRFRNQWVRRRGKVPLQVPGVNAPSTSPGTWLSFDAVSASRVGDGLGIMLGNGLGCLDPGHCIDAGGVVASWVLVAIAKTENIVFIEVSLPGDGLYVFRSCPEASGRRFPQVGGSTIEVYSRSRFTVCTGNVWGGWHCSS